MATTTGSEYDHITISDGTDQTIHYLKDTVARGDISDLKIAVEVKRSVPVEQGALNTTTGATAGSQTRVRSKDFLSADDGVMSVVVNNGYAMLPYAYESVGGNYVGFWKNGTWTTSGASSATWVSEFDVGAYRGYKLKFMIKDASDASAEITPTMYGDLDARYGTDNTLTIANKPADAAQTGDYMVRTTSSLSGASQVPVSTSGYIVTSGSTADVETVITSAVWTHTVISAVEGETYYVTGVSGTDARLWAFVDDNGNVLDNADADTKYWNEYIEAPENTAYLIVHSYKGRTILYSGVTIRKQVESRSIKLHLCAWNIGNYNYGRNATAYPRQNGILKSKLVREFIRDEFPDILVLTEFYHINLTDGTTTIASKDDIKTVYRYYFKRNQLLIASNWPITNGATGTFTAQAEDQQKEWSKADIFVKSKKVTIFSAHFASGTDYTSVREAQYQEIISMLANTDSAIILGDFNSYTIGQMDTWTEAGYTILNGGYNGTYLTCPALAPVAPLDNIVLKGNNIYGVGYPHAAICDPEHDDDKEYYVADHLPFMADVVIS